MEMEMSMSDEKETVEGIMAEELVCPLCGQYALRVLENQYEYEHGWCDGCDSAFDAWNVDYSERDAYESAIAEVPCDGAAHPDEGILRFCPLVVRFYSPPPRFWVGLDLL